MGLEDDANKVLSDLAAKKITEDEARRQFAELGVDPDHAEEMIAIERGDSDVEEI